MMGFADLHAHFVYGIDDGAQTSEEMEEMLDAAQADNVCRLVATPHITPGVSPFEEALFRQRLEEARQYCAMRRYPMEIYAGAEVLYTPMFRQYISDGRLPVIGNTDCVLLEFVPDISMRDMREAIMLAEQNGYRVILAHMERYKCMFVPGAARRLKEEFDVLYQVNCGTLLTSRGFWRDPFIERWFQAKLIDFVASDCHNCGARPTRMSEAYEVLKKKYGDAYARSLMGARKRPEE